MTLSVCPTLEIGGVRLEQLSEAHAEDLAQVLQRDNLAQLWFAKSPTAQGINAEIKRRLDLQSQKKMAPFAIIDLQTNRAVGATTYMNLDPVNKRLEIGSTFLAIPAQGTGINPAAKYLLLKHAFEELGCIAVEFRTHWHNQASRAAIARLGAKQDGVLRNHMYDPVTDSMRDTVVFSILPHEWNAVRANLLARMTKHGRLS